MSDVNEEAREQAASLREGGARQLASVAGNLSAADTAEHIVERALEKFDGVDILVANAGGGVIRPTLGHTEETLQATIDRSLWTALRRALAVIPPMRDVGYGRAVFTGADSMRNGLDGHASYNAAKEGVQAMARGFARELGRDGLTFDNVALSATRTAELERLFDSGLGERFLQVIPVGRPAEPTETPSALRYLASEEASFITGQVLGVKGGAKMG